MVSTPLLIYAGHFFSSWGDRMWHFTIPLFLINLKPQSMTLSAAYGLTLALSVLLFGPLVGDEIDRKPRLYSARVALVIQNLAVMFCAVLLVMNHWYGDKNAWYLVLVEIGAIVLGAISQLASVATRIIIQKDWIVEVAQGKKEMLANLNAMVRRIDLTAKILSPLACGQIMLIAELSGGAIFIACWNACSMIIEYLLLKKVYDRTPSLAKKKDDKPKEEEMAELQKQVDAEKDSTTDVAVKASTEDKKEKPVWWKMLSFIFTVKNGWQLYMVQPIALPCIGFSFLYMTILGFGYLTISYAYSQCFSELMVGVLLAGAAVTGIIATCVFPVMREKIGLIRTGLLNAFFQISTLGLCIPSVFVPGSPFILLSVNQEQQVSNTSQPQTTTDTAFSFISANDSVSTGAITSPTPDMFQNSTSVGSENSGTDLFFKCLEGVKPPSSYLSVSVLMAGIILARVGLWGFDLTITQLIQENVKENERGVFSGVQSSLNNFMGLIQFVLVLALPKPEQFGILVMLSSAATCIGYLLYCVYVWRIHGHLSHYKQSHAVIVGEGADA